MEISYVCLEIIVNAKCWHVLVAHISMCPQRCPAMSTLTAAQPAIYDDGANILLF